MADNPGGGARGDSSFALQAVLSLGIPNVALGGLWDPGAVQLCFEAGLGSTLALRVAGKVEPVFVDQIADMPQAVMNNARDGDVLICMGAGSIGGTPAQVVNLAGSVQEVSA
jgi:UDP-N-acetylmuramate--alanine ligase